MSIEAATLIHQLVVTNPDGDNDDVSVGDDHIKLIKSTLKNTFANVLGAVTASHTELNYLVGVSSAVLHNAQKNVANGVGGLDSAARLLAAQMPADPSFTTTRMTSTATADLSSGAHAVQIGASTAVNLAVSAGIIQGRNNGSPSNLQINPYGGSLVLGKSSTDTALLLPTGAVPEMYYAGRRLFRGRSDASGASGIEVGTTAGGLLYHDGTNLLARNQISSGFWYAQGYTSGAALVDLFNANPNGAFSSYYGGSLRINTEIDGATFTVPGSSVGKSNYYYGASLKGSVRWTNSEFQIVGESGSTYTALYGTTDGITYTRGLSVSQSGNVYIGAGLTLLSTYISDRINTWQGLVQGGVTGSISGANGTTTVTFSTPYSATPVVTVTPNISTGSLNGNVSVYNVSTTGFTVLNSMGVAATINWMSLGNA